MHAALSHLRAVLSVVLSSSLLCLLLIVSTTEDAKASAVALDHVLLANAGVARLADGLPLGGSNLSHVILLYSAVTLHPLGKE